MWRESVDERSDTPEHVRSLRETLVDALRGAREAHAIHLGDFTNDSDTPVVGADDLRVVTDHARTIVSTVEDLARALDTRTHISELAALRAMWRHARGHMEALDATIRDVETIAWTQTRTPQPTESPSPGGTENLTTPEAGPAQPADAPTPESRGASPRSDPPPPPRSEFDHWNGIALASARNRRGGHHRARRRDALHRRHHNALIRAWNVATDPRVPPETPSQRIRDLRDQGDRYTAVARAAARLTASPQRAIERAALHELRVAAELHARHLRRQADALDPPRRRPRLSAVRLLFAPRPPRQRPDPEAVLARIADAEKRARRGIAGRDARAKEHLHTTGPEHDRLIRDIRAEHAAAHEVMRDVRTRSWWRRANPGEIAAIWQRAVEWSAHHDVIAGRILRHMRGRIRQHHGVDLPTPPVNGVDLNPAIAHGRPAPAEGPAVRWAYTVRDPLLHTRLLDQGRYTALARDTPETVGRRVLADLAARGADPAVLRRAVVEVVPADRPDTAPVVVTAARIPEIGRDQAARDRAEHDLAQAGAALKSALDHRWWEDARPVEIGWMWRGVQDWQDGPARDDALTFLADRIRDTFGITLTPDTPAVVATERIREHAPAPLDPNGAPERALAAHAVRFFDLAHGIEARIAAGDVPEGDVPGLRQQARSHSLRARHLGALASDPEEAARLLGAARPPAIDVDRYHRDIAGEYERSWGRALTDDESAQLRSILERGSAGRETDPEPADGPVAGSPPSPALDTTLSTDAPRPLTPSVSEPKQPEEIPPPSDRASRPREPRPETPLPTNETGTATPATEHTVAPAAQIPARPQRRRLSTVRLVMDGTDEALAPKPASGPPPARRAVPVTSVTPELADSAAPALGG
ncbi:hypothetical protein [Embleya sp. MST-111070]|uniref:hypothetical protein n=1 Tax=Embleya sp. MST-111070 TaxID=3398231 RepID=UPI003F7343A5